MPLDAPIRDNVLPRRAMKAEMLDAETEHELAIAWRDDRDEAALHRLINAYMRLGVSVAAKYKRYGAPMNDLIQEASVGLMKAAEKFDPDRGVRFSTYAVWWIKASVQEHVMRNWSLVRTGSTSSQKSLFFNMRRVQARLRRETEALGMVLSAGDINEKVAIELGVSLRDVEMMDGRLSGSDMSLNAQQSGEDEGREWIETIEDDSETAAEAIAYQHDQQAIKSWLDEAMGSLKDREKYILQQRKLVAEPQTLEVLGLKLKLSKERVRQLEAAALNKMRQQLDLRGDDIQAFLH